MNRRHSKNLLIDGGSTLNNIIVNYNGDFSNENNINLSKKIEESKSNFIVNNNNINNDINIDKEIERVNFKIKESITLLVKEKMKLFEEEIINDLFNNISNNSPKLLEQSKIYLSSFVNNNKNNSVIHNIKCSFCNEIIIGELFKCTQCREYYLCSNCEEFSEHDENHIFMKIKNPKDDKINLNNIPQYL